MDFQIVAVFCHCKDMQNPLRYNEDRQGQMTDTEVMTTTIITALHFRAYFESARLFLHYEDYFRHILGKSGYNRHLHRIKDMFLILIDTQNRGACAGFCAWIHY